MSIFTAFSNMVDKGLTKYIFDHVRNLCLCGLLFAAGTFALHHPGIVLFGLIPERYPGWVLIGFAGVLTLLNVYDGIYKLRKFNSSGWATVVLIFLYLIISIRIVQLVWGLRAGA